MDKPSRSRRDVLKALASVGTLSALPDSITQALAIPAHQRTGTIKDVQHIVVLTQENRSFDHCFGTLRGVRGFGDPRAAKLPSGRPVWMQPSANGEVLPFRPPVPHLGGSYLPDPPHGWTDGHAAWNQGRFDQWIANKGIVAMTHNLRSDMPFHFALADAFTVCDAYHCSLMGPTDPNRYHLWTGWTGNDGSGGGPVITNAEAGYAWKTFPERLLEAGISWKVYQDKGDGLFASDTVWWGWTGDAFIGNYGDNSLLFFKQYQNAQAGTPLAERAKSGTEIKLLNRDPLRLLEDFRADVAAGRLPQVSWIAAPEAYTEHPNWPTDFGAWYISRVLDALVANPEVWSRTVLLINYDEEGGFFDHVVPPTPPISAELGDSTVPTTNEIFAGDANGHPAGPYGFGLRVPLLVVSPWSRGGWVNSQVFDHTSVIRFIEKRFADEHPGIVETNITPWRRAVSGDLSSCFDFRAPNAARPATPDVSAYMPVDKTNKPDMALAVPGTQTLPQQEPGVRWSRALPYELQADGALDTSSGTFRIVMSNSGEASAVFQVRSGNPADLPRCYTVEPRKQLSGSWNAASATQRYDLEVHGPNGFLRAFRGASAGNSRANLEVQARLQPHALVLVLTIRNLSAQRAQVQVTDRYSGETRRQQLHPRDADQAVWTAVRHGGWYDLVITVVGDADFRVELAGRIENGRDGISDPAIGRL
ncbi:phospholipase C, phosphocholine-specific [Piscinibacter sp. XHJ-5]|uniref:phosphocholine-specific phospholipase C n=1 Tax=Piscinibacter sp. XHJ-5 TaxID=3037797 RepID=UPI002452B820|nr:phospholipase C, phosphocholine-specific [Piscinibacter sp. XHJ-5]